MLPVLVVVYRLTQALRELTKQPMQLDVLVAADASSRVIKCPDAAPLLSLATSLRAVSWLACWPVTRLYHAAASVSHGHACSEHQLADCLAYVEGHQGCMQQFCCVGFCTQVVHGLQSAVCHAAKHSELRARYPVETISRAPAAHRNAAHGGPAGVPVPMSIGAPVPMSAGIVVPPGGAAGVPPAGGAAGMPPGGPAFHPQLGGLLALVTLVSVVNFREALLHCTNQYRLSRA